MVWSEISYNRIEIERQMGRYFGTTEYDPIEDINTDSQQTDSRVKEVNKVVTE